MLDTVRLRSGSLSEELAGRIEQSCHRRQGVEIATGEVLYSFTTGSLSGSWDDRVSVRVLRDEWVAVEREPEQEQPEQVAVQGRRSAGRFQDAAGEQAYQERAEELERGAAAALELGSRRPSRAKGRRVVTRQRSCPP